MRFFVALLVLAGVASGQEADIRAAEAAWAKAVVAKDAASLGRLLGDQLIYGHSTGVVDTKSDYIGKLNSGRQKYAGIEHQSMTVKMHGNTAIVNARVHMWGVNPDGKFDDQLMMLHVWLKTGPAWQLVGHQTSKLK
ncbi:MAG: nuclear transport factor 2 family protein [Acidobacteria bacterium]|nr:nuclear transport factor 2 family protein [Acidobacteriota bacterium]